MAVKLLTIESSFRDEDGLYIRPGVPMAWLSAEPGLSDFRQGATLELRRPDGATQRTQLLQYGASIVRGEDGSFYVPSGADGKPEWVIVFTLPPDVATEDVPPGTEVWVL